MRTLWLTVPLLLLAACEPQPPAGRLVELPPLSPRLAQVHADYCGRCHGRDVPGTPRAGRPADWQVRANKGLDVLVRNAMQGYRGMPPMGMCQDCSEEEIRALVEYMLSGTSDEFAPTN